MGGAAVSFSLTQEDVLALAAFARIDVSPDEAAQMAPELAGIIQTLEPLDGYVVGEEGDIA